MIKKIFIVTAIIFISLPMSGCTSQNESRPTDIIFQQRENLFKANATMLLREVQFQRLNDPNFDVEGINVNNMNDILGISSEVFESVEFKIENNEIFMTANGKDKYKNFTAYNNEDNEVVIIIND